AWIANGYSRDPLQLRAKPLRERNDSALHCRHSPGKRVVNRDAEANFARNVALPVLEAASIRANLVTIRGGPRRGVQVEEWRLQLLDQARANVQKAGAARAAQVFAPGTREHVTAKKVRVHVELAN